jgi:hypothetical protein
MNDEPDFAKNWPKEGARPKPLTGKQLREMTAEEVKAYYKDCKPKYTETQAKFILAGILLVPLLLIGSCYAIFHRDGRETKAIQIARDTVRRQITNSSDAEFDMDAGVQCLESPDGKVYIVVGTVHVLNDFGARLSRKYRVGMLLQHDGKWAVGTCDVSDE